MSRLKVEEEERKRQEDKARRDAIFEKYMRRKMAAEGTGESEMKPSPPTQPPIVLRKKSGTNRAARPLSQPPPASFHASSPAVNMDRPMKGNMRVGSAVKGNPYLSSHGSEDRLLSAEDLSTAAMNARSMSLTSLSILLI